MDCLYQAYSDHLADLGLKANWLDAALYRLLKWQTHGLRPQPTFGGVVPYIIQSLADMRLGRVKVTAIQHRLWTPAHYHYTTQRRVQRIIIDQFNFGEEVPEITLSPAIYLCLSTHHIFYASVNVKMLWPNIVMAIQLRRRYIVL